MYLYWLYQLIPTYLIFPCWIHWYSIYYLGHHHSPISYSRKAVSYGELKSFIKHLRCRTHSLTYLKYFEDCWWHVIKINKILVFYEIVCIIKSIEIFLIFGCILNLSRINMLWGRLQNKCYLWISLN